MSVLPAPFNTFVVEKHAGERKDFGLAADDPYPLKGITYPVDYGEIAGYVTEDGTQLDLFVGSAHNGIMGYIIVERPELEGGEHKFYMQLTKTEERAVLGVFRSVLLDAG